MSPWVPHWPHDTETYSNNNPPLAHDCTLPYYIVLHVALGSLQAWGEGGMEGEHNGFHEQSPNGIVLFGCIELRLVLV